MVRLAEPFLKGPISARRRKSIYKLIVPDSGHETALKIINLWEREIGSVENASSGIREFLAIVSKTSFLTTAPIVFASGLTKMMSNPKAIDDDLDPIIHFGNGSAQPGAEYGSQMSPSTTTLSLAVASISEVFAQEDAKGLMLATQAILSNGKMLMSTRQFIVGMIRGKNGPSGWAASNSEGRMVIHVLYTNMLEGLGPIRADEIMKQMVRSIEGTPVDRAYPLRSFL